MTTRPVTVDDLRRAEAHLDVHIQDANTRLAMADRRLGAIAERIDLVDRRCGAMSDRIDHQNRYLVANAEVHAEDLRAQIRSVQDQLDAIQDMLARRRWWQRRRRHQLWRSVRPSPAGPSASLLLGLLLLVTFGCFEQRPADPLLQRLTPVDGGSLPAPMLGGGIGVVDLLDRSLRHGLGVYPAGTQRAKFTGQALGNHPAPPSLAAPYAG